MKRNEYLSLRGRYEPEPENIELIIIAESPPASGRYFYKPEGRVTESLFAALMLQLGLSPISKKAGLREFQQRGWVLVDATYEPVNEMRNARRRDDVIIRDYGLLRADLAKLMPDQSIPLVLIKANVCRILEPKLANDGFTVLNAGRPIYFPAAGQQKNFQRQFATILRSQEQMAGSLDQLLTCCRENGRVCPMPNQWHQLWDMLPEKESSRHGMGALSTTNTRCMVGSIGSEKTGRLESHLRWASDHGVLDEVAEFLRSLPESDWHHQGD